MRTLCIAALLLVAAGIPTRSFAENEATTYVDVKKSLSTLLNEGWKIESMASFDTSWETYNASSTDLAVVAWPTKSEMDYLLSKGGKYIHCFLIQPKTTGAMSNCRALN